MQKLIRDGVLMMIIQIQKKSIYRSLQGVQSGLLDNLNYMSKQKRSHKRYAKISVYKRQALIKMVLQEGKTQKSASEKLKIKLETAKLIIRKYRRTGTVFQKKMSLKKQNDDKKSQKQPQIEQQCKSNNMQRLIDKKYDTEDPDHRV